MPKRTNAEVASLLAARIADQVKRGLNKGLQAGAIFLASRIKEELSVPAPRKAMRAPAQGKKKGAIFGYRATTRATPLAPPRKLSGRLRASITHRMITPLRAVIGTNVKYGRYLELSKRHPHKFLMPTAKKYRKEIAAIIGKAVKMEVK